MLPPNRQLKKLSEIWVFIRWVSYKKPELLLTYQNWCVTLLRANNIQWNKLDLSEVQYLPNWYTKDEQITKENDILLCMSSGSSHLVGKNVKLQKLNNFSFGAFCSIFRLTKFNDCNIDYLSHCLQWNIYFEYITNISRWAGINNLRNSDLEDFKIPLPPLATQHKIVAKLDEISANIQDSKSKITDEINKLDKLWASSLGKVFEKWWWKLQTINSISHKIQYWYTWKTTEKGQFRYLRITDIQNDNVEWEKVPFVEISPEEAKKYELNTGDVVFARTGATVGKSFLIDKIGEDKIFASYLIRVVPNYEYIKPEFLKYFFQSEIYWSQILADVVWAAQPNFNGKKLGEIIIPLPDLETQKSIVSHLDQLSQTISHIKAEYQWQLAYHDDLWASVLDQAFKGELVKE